MVYINSLRTPHRLTWPNEFKRHPNDHTTVLDIKRINQPRDLFNELQKKNVCMLIMKWLLPSHANLISEPRHGTHRPRQRIPCATVGACSQACYLGALFQPCKNFIVELCPRSFPGLASPLPKSQINTRVSKNTQQAQFGTGKMNASTWTLGFQNYGTTIK